MLRQQASGGFSYWHGRESARWQHMVHRRVGHGSWLRAGNASKLLRLAVTCGLAAIDHGNVALPLPKEYIAPGAGGSPVSLP